VPIETLAGAKRYAADVFRASGISLSWVDCPISNEEVDKFRPYSDVTDPVVLLLRIVPPSMSTGLQRSIDAFGTASHVSAHVFSERLQDLAEEHQVPVQKLLGAVMAHELGHMLLGEDSHSPVGIMQPTLRRKDFEPASGSLLFTRQQVNLMKALLMNPG
jgi:hypothetical protein